jgi:GT2 family glycosyltransferase
MTPTIDVVIPVRDMWSLTANCLEHLRGQSIPHTVVVCDNGSTDGTPDRLTESFPDVRLVELGRNRGFAFACNRGVESGSADIVVLLNNDVLCQVDFLERLIAPFARPEVGAVAALLTQRDTDMIESVGIAVDVTLAGFPRLRGRPVARAADARPVLLGPYGAAGAYRRSAWDSVGGLDEGLFFYGEDTELAMRLRSAGWLSERAPDAVAVHLGSASASSGSAWQRYHTGFARGYTVRRYGVHLSRAAPRAFVTEVIVALGDAVLSRDAAALRGRLAGWRAAGHGVRVGRPPADAIDSTITLSRSLRLRVASDERVAMSLRDRDYRSNHPPYQTD